MIDDNFWICVKRTMNLFPFPLRYLCFSLLYSVIDLGKRRRQITFGCSVTSALRCGVKNLAGVQNADNFIIMPESETV